MVALTDAPALAFFLTAVGFVAGYLFGNRLTHKEWVRNALSYRRKKAEGRSFKVVETGDSESWAMAELYKPYEMREGYDRR